MSPPPVKIRIGGELDGSLSRALATANQQIDKAAKQSQKSQKDTTKSAEQEAKAQLRAQQQMNKAIESLDRQRSRGLFEQFKAQEAGAERAAKAQERSVARAQAAERREIEKTMRAAQRAFEEEAKAGARARAQSLDRFATRTSHRTTRFLMPEAPIGPMVMRGLSSMTRGLGVDFDLGSNMSRVAEFESAIVGLRNQARVAGSPMRDSGAAEIKSAADRYGYKRVDTAAAVGAFATKTGDVNLGLDTMQELAKRAAATGSSFEEMMDAAADVSNGLGNIPDKSKKMLETIDGFIVQGARGAVEIKDLASKMPKFAASAGRFQGDAATNMLKLGALGQLARSTGGATSAAEAATSVARFADTFGTNARVAAFKKIGISVLDENKQIRDPFQIIREALTKTKGDPLAMGKLFASSLGVRSVRGLSNAYLQAGGGDTGLKAVENMLGGFMNNLKLADDVLKKNIAERDASTQVQAQKFNNELEEVTTQLSAGFLPVLRDLRDPALNAAKGLGQLATWAGKNPGEALFAAIGASMARAGLESALRNGIENAIKGAAGGLPGKGLGGGIGILGNLSAALAITTLSVATFEAGKLIINSDIERREKEQRDAAIGEATAGATEAEMARRQRGGTYKAEDEKFATEKEQALQERIGKATWQRDVDAANGGPPTSDWKLAFENLLNPDIAKARGDAQHLEALKAEMARVHDMLEAIHSGTLKVEVTNPTEGGYDAPVTGHRVSN